MRVYRVMFQGEDGRVYGNGFPADSADLEYFIYEVKRLANEQGLLYVSEGVEDET